MKRIFFALAGALAITTALVLAAACSSSSSPKQGIAERIFNVVEDFEALPNGETDCTAAFNAAISAASEAFSKESLTGKAVVLVPEGKYHCSTIFMKSNVELRLEKGAVILGSEDPESYSSYVPTCDMSRYDSGDGTVNSNNSRDKRWNRALILGVEVENVSITGEGKIEGGHVFDPLGEEYMRGPHTIIFAQSSNLFFDGFTIGSASNYAFMGYALEDAEFANLHIMEGWDGIHIRGGKNIEIHDCAFETGDDSIAGGYWENVSIHDNFINSSCNGIRMIMPSQDLTIMDCTFEGPGKYPHRTSSRTNMLFGVSLEPGAWGTAKGELGGIVLENLTMKNVSSPVSISVREGSIAHDLVLRNIISTGTYGTLSPTVCWCDSGFESICVENFVVSR